MQLEGLTVLSNDDGSNVLPTLVLLAFLRPYACGGGARGSCTALCDLDTLCVRAVSLFGHSETTRWVLPVSSRNPFTLHDLRRANQVRSAVSRAFGVVNGEQQDEPTTHEQSSSVPWILEDPEISRALGALVAEAGRGPSLFGDGLNAAESLPVDGDRLDVDEPGVVSGEALPGAAAARIGEPAASTPQPGKACTQASAKRTHRELGHVWIDLNEVGGACEDTALKTPSGETSSIAASRQSGEADGAGPFFSFDMSVEQLAQGGGEKEAETHDPLHKAVATELSEPKSFALLPDLMLDSAMLERTRHFRRMQAEAKDIMALARQDSKEARRCVRELRGMGERFGSAVRSAQRAWDMAMEAESKSSIERAMGRATSTMQAVNGMVAAISKASERVGEMLRSAVEREQRASDGARSAPHFWTAVAKATRSARDWFSSQAAAIAQVLQSTEAPKCMALRKADDTVKLINEKLQRWADEEQILREEARAQEQNRVAAAQQAAEAERQRQQAELRKQQDEMMQRREAAIQWGRKFVEPMPDLVYAAGQQAAGASLDAGAPPPPPPPGGLPLRAVPPPLEEAPRLPPGLPPLPPLPRLPPQPAPLQSPEPLQARWRLGSRPAG
mmetsp:Transcript_41067/g.127246  ORF Transcript_41067/g.127246 Transcript_41067/m.127246 type:complete len:617 (-) Transcript_41067:223-2073(-)